MRQLALLLVACGLVLGWSSSALADNDAVIVEETSDGCTIYKLCDQEDIASFCESTVLEVTDDIVLSIVTPSTWEFRADESDGGSYSCDVYTHIGCSDVSDSGCEKSKLIDGMSKSNTTASVTNVLTGLPEITIIDQVHVQCTDVGSTRGGPTIEVTVCPGQP